MADEFDYLRKQSGNRDDALLLGVERRVGRPPRRMSWMRLFGARSKMPPWVDEYDLTKRIFAAQARIVRDGNVRWAYVIHANDTIWSPGPIDTGAQVVYAPRGDVSLEKLGEIAERAFALKGTQPEDPVEAKLAYMLTDELQRALDWPLPPSITDGRQVVTTIVILPRKHMPGGYLAMKYFPIFAEPRSLMATLVPSRYWPAELRERWRRVVDERQTQLEAYREWIKVRHKEPDGGYVVELTARAAERIRGILDGDMGGVGRLLVEVIENGDGSWRYNMRFLEDPPDRDKQVVYTCRGVSIAIDLEHVQYIDGTVLDFEEDAGGFRFHNPNVTEVEGR